MHEIYDQLDDEFEHSQSAKSQEHNSSGQKLCGLKRRASKSLVMDQDQEEPDETESEDRKNKR